MDVKDVVVMLMRVDDRPFLDRTELDALIDATGIELLAVDEEAEFLPMAASKVEGRWRRQKGTRQKK